MTAFRPVLTATLTALPGEYGLEAQTAIALPPSADSAGRIRVLVGDAETLRVYDPAPEGA